MNTTKYPLLGMLLCGAMANAFLAACEDDKIEYVEVEQWVTNPDSLGQYEFHDKTYTIQLAAYSRKEGSLTFLFSPKASTDTLSTFFTLSLQEELAMGDTCYFADYYNANDYLFAYEDPAFSYSSQHGFLDGWVVVDQYEQNPDSMSVVMNALLADSTTFKIDISSLMHFSGETE